MARRKSGKRKINPLKLRLRYLLASCILIALAAAGTKAVHYFGDAQTKEFVERGVVAVIDVARESTLVPDEAVFILDTLALYLPFVYGESVDPGVSLDAGTAVLAGTPVAETRLTFLKNDAYLVGYDEVRGNPAWCAYRVFHPETTQAAERPANFATDSRTRARVNSTAYSNSGYDRGHMAPNHAIALCYGETAQTQTFLMSNIVPQRHALNAGLWKQLEQRVLKRYTRQFGDVWVLCGPIYTRERPARLKGKNRARVSPAIPDAFFLIVAEREEDSGALRSLAFIVPHQDSLSSNPRDYLVSIDEIERQTGLDFFAQLPQAAQAKLEDTRAKTVW